MFNLMDVVVILIILISAFIGYKRGLVKTIFSLCSFFVALGLALLFYKPLSVILIEKTSIDEWIIDRIVAAEEASGDVVEETEELVQEEVEEGFSLKNILKELPEMVVSTVDVQVKGARELAKHEFAVKTSELVMKLLSLIIIYVIVRVTLLITMFVLNEAMKIPVLKQINEVLGMAIGAALGFVEIYIAFAIIALINSVTDISFVVGAIKASAFASIMFDSNLIIRLLS